MSNNKIRCCILGGQEKDLFVLGELHKQRQVEIAFVYDKDSSAVGLEIAEILGIPRVSQRDDLSRAGALEYVVVSEPRTAFEMELSSLSRAGARVISQSEALSLFGVKSAVAADVAPVAVAVPEGRDSETYSVEDALSAFERLFDRKKLLKFLLDVAVQAVSATAGSIMLYSEESSELYIAYATGLSERVVRNTRQKLGDGIAGAVAKERRGRLIRESRDQRLYPVDRDRAGIRCGISVPLVWEYRLLGVLNVSSDSPSRELNEEGLHTLERLSARISRVLNESLKLQETQVRHRELNLRQSMGELAEKSISSQAKFSLISNLLGELVGADTVEVFVGTQEGDWLILGGSNRRIPQHPEMIKCERGALSRAFLERRTIVLTEAVEHRGETHVLLSSFAFVPLFLKDNLGVLMMEFSDPHKLDDFILIKDSVTLELSRFIASEKREKNLRRELEALGKVSDAAPVLLTCHTLDDLCDYLARLGSDALEAERVSVRIQGVEGSAGKIARFEAVPDPSGGWMEEDEERFLKLRKKPEAFSLAFLNFAPEARDRVPAYHSLLAVPVRLEGSFRGGIIVYDKRPTNPLEDATFSELDRTILQHIVSIAEPVVRALSLPGKAAAEDTARSYDEVLHDNSSRLKKVLASEMSRSDRYHHSFALLLLRINPLEKLFAAANEEALSLVDEITRGIQTRTRKTDYGMWIRRDTFAMVSLEGSPRIRFLVSRLMLYLLKDFSTVSGHPISAEDVLVSHSFYPGTARTPEALVEEVEKSLQPHHNEH